MRIDVLLQVKEELYLHYYKLVFKGNTVTKLYAY